jgi:hypothetical protein
VLLIVKDDDLIDALNVFDDLLDKRRTADLIYSVLILSLPQHPESGRSDVNSPPTSFDAKIKVLSIGYPKRRVIFGQVRHPGLENMACASLGP